MATMVQQLQKMILHRVITEVFKFTHIFCIKFSQLRMISDHCTVIQNCKCKLYDRKASTPTMTAELS